MSLVLSSVINHMIPRQSSNLLSVLGQQWNENRYFFNKIPVVTETEALTGLVKFLEGRKVCHINFALLWFNLDILKSSLRANSWLISARFSLRYTWNIPWFFYDYFLIPIYLDVTKNLTKDYFVGEPRYQHPPGAQYPQREDRTRLGQG